MFDFVWKNRPQKLNFFCLGCFEMKLPIFKKRLILRLPSDFSFVCCKTKIHDFRSGLFSREVTSLFEKPTILYHAKFIFLSFDMALFIFVASVSDHLNQVRINFALQLHYFC